MEEYRHLADRVSATEENLRLLANSHKRQGEELSTQTTMIREIHSALVGKDPLDPDNNSGLVRKSKLHSELLEDQDARISKLENKVTKLKEKTENQKDAKLKKFEGLGWGLAAFVVGKLGESLFSNFHLFPPHTGGHP